MTLSLDASPPGTYRQQGTSSLQMLFCAHFPDLHARCESDFAKRLGRFRLPRISSAVERFLGGPLRRHLPQGARGTRAVHRARPPVSLKKMLVEEHDGSVLYTIRI
jgi:hypothetical protein